MTGVYNVLGGKKEEEGLRDQLKMAFGDKQKEWTSLTQAARDL